MNGVIVVFVVVFAPLLAMLLVACLPLPLLLVRRLLINVTKHLQVLPRGVPNRLNHEREDVGGDGAVVDFRSKLVVHLKSDDESAAATKVGVK